MANLSYTKKVMDLFQHPKNMGEIKNPDGQGMVGNPVCGDVMQIYLKISERQVKGKSEKYIKDIKFQTLGCAAAIATSSILTVMAKGKSLVEAAKIKDNDVVKELGGLPKPKYHCSLLAVQGLKKAIEDYSEKKS